MAKSSTERKRQTPREKREIVAISLFSGAITEGERAVRLSPRERQLLTCLAARQCGLSAPLDVAPPALRVLALRVRARFETDVLHAAGIGEYRLTDNVRIDLSALRYGMLDHRAGSADSDALAARTYALLEQLRTHPARGRAWFKPLQTQLERIARALIKRAVTDARVAGLL